MRGEYRTHASPRLRVHICRLPPYAAYHVCMSVCLSIGLSYICANSKCERKRPGLGRASEMCTILSSYIWLICIFLQYCQGGGLEIASELWVVIWIRRVMNSKRGHISTASRQRLAHRSVQAFTHGCKGLQPRARRQQAAGIDLHVAGVQA